MLVAGMAAHTDISKAHEVANEIRRIHKQLKEAQTDSSKYNNRERLFGMPVTNVSDWIRCTIDIMVNQQQATNPFLSCLF